MKLFALILCFVSANALAQSAEEKVLGWKKSANLGANLSFSSSQDVVGQTDGQRILAALVPDVERVSQRSLNASLNDLGGACWRSDLASLQHETQYTRLFRS